MRANKSDIGSDLAQVDAHELTSADFDEIPEASDEDFARGTVNKGGKPVRGRPSLGEKAKRHVSLRLDPEVIARFKSAGAGWQFRINSWLAARQEIVDLIIDYETSLSEMRGLLLQLKDPAGGLRASKPDQVDAIEAVERQIAVTENAAGGVRRVLREQALTVPIRPDAS